MSIRTYRIGASPRPIAKSRKHPPEHRSSYDGSRSLYAKHYLAQFRELVMDPANPEVPLVDLSPNVRHTLSSP